MVQKFQSMVTWLWGGNIVADGITEESCSTCGVPKQRQEKTKEERELEPAVVPKTMPSGPSSTSETSPPNSYWAVSVLASHSPLQEPLTSVSLAVRINWTQKQLFVEECLLWSRVCRKNVYKTTDLREDQKNHRPNLEGEKVCVFEKEEGCR